MSDKKEKTVEVVEMEKIVSFAKRRGFVFSSSEIYGGFAAVYDFGPYGTELAKNIREAHLVMLADSVIRCQSAKSVMRVFALIICLRKRVYLQMKK